MTRLRAFIWPILIGIVGCFWVAFRVTVPGIRADEAYTLIGSKRNIKALMRMLPNYDAVHGLYYVIMHYWLLLVPYSTFTLRLPSVISVGATATFVILIARKFVPKYLAILAGFIFLVTPRTVWLATDARPNAPAMLAVTIATYFFILALEDGRTRWWLAYSFFALCSVYFVVYTAAVFAGFGLIALVRWWRHRQNRELFWVLGSGAVLLVACLPVFYQSARQQSFIGWRKLVTWQIVAESPAEVFCHQMDPFTTTAWMALLAASTIVLLVAIWRQKPMRHASMSLKLGLAIGVAWWLIPMGAVMAVGVFRSMFYARYFSFATPVLALLIVSALAQLGWNKRKHLIVAAVTIVTLAIPAAIQMHHVEVKDGGGVYYSAQKILDYRQPGDGMWMTARYAMWAYPETMVDAVDLNLKETINQTWRLNESTYALREVPDRVAAVNRIIAVLEKPNEASDLEDQEFLKKQGFHVVSDEIVVRARIIVFERG